MPQTTPLGPLALHLGLAAIGPGMLTLPYAFGHTGVLGGLAIVLVSWAASILSTIAIYDAAAYVAQRDRSDPPPSYGYLVQQLLDRRWALLLDAALTVSGVGGAISFLIFLGDFIPPALHALVPSRDPVWLFLTQRQAVIVESAFICAGLSTADNGIGHPVLSMIPILGFTGCVLALLYRVLSSGGSGLWAEGAKLARQLHWTAQGFSSLNLFLFAFMMQANVLPTFAAVSPVPPTDVRLLEEVKSPLLRARLSRRILTEPAAEARLDSSPLVTERFDLPDYAGAGPQLGTLPRATMLQAVLLAQTATLLYYALLTVLGLILVLRAGAPSIPQDFTRALPDADLFYVWIRATLILCLLVLSPYLFSAVSNGCMNLVAVALGRPMIAKGFGSFRNRLAYSAALVAASALVALRTDRVATILTVLGGWGATIMMCSVPPVLLLRVARETGSFAPGARVSVAFGGAMTAVGFAAAVLPLWI